MSYYTGYYKKTSYYMHNPPKSSNYGSYIRKIIIGGYLLPHSFTPYIPNFHCAVILSAISFTCFFFFPSVSFSAYAFSILNA